MQWGTNASEKEGAACLCVQPGQASHQGGDKHGGHHLHFLPHGHHHEHHLPLTFCYCEISAGPSHDHPSWQASLSSLPELHLRNISRRLAKIQLETVGAAGNFFGHFFFFYVSIEDISQARCLFLNSNSSSSSSNARKVCLCYFQLRLSVQVHATCLRRTLV